MEKSELRSVRRTTIFLIITLAIFLILLLSRPLLSANQAAVRVPSSGKAGVRPLSTHADRNLSGMVDTLIGTGEQKGLSVIYSGDTFPGADVPFGMVQWSPDTVSHAYSSYVYSDDRLKGFSLTHLSGAGCSIYGDVPFLPYTGLVSDSPASDSTRYISTFSHANETGNAGYYKVRLNNGVTTELSVAQHSGAARFSYPADKPETMLINLSGSSNGINAEQASIGRDTISGWVGSGNFCHKGDTYRVYFWVQFSQPFASVGTWQKDAVFYNRTATAGPYSGVFVTFAQGQQTTIGARVGVSFVSVANAESNVDWENPSGDFDTIHQQATRTWDHWLSEIQVSGGTPAQTATFYAALYHSLLFPSVFSDVNGEYMGFDGRVHSVAATHAQYANFSGWDIYRSQVQLLTLLAPAQASDIAQSLLNDYEQGGSLPKWPVANGESYMMVGDPADAIIADIYAFGGTNFDAYAALDAMIEQATHPGRVRPGLQYLETLGYEPLDGTYDCCNAYGSASTTLEYSTADFAIGSLAGALGDESDDYEFIRRAQDWRNLFNPTSGYLEPRNTDGTFPVAFSPMSKNGWVEGDSAQYSWMVPFNLHDLFAAMGGDARVVPRLDAFFTQLNAGQNAPYAFLGNEPTLEVPWEYDYAGVPYKTQQVVRRTVNTLYLPDPIGLPGNDDLGEMSSWYIFAALGMYPETPGTADLILASPLFPSITLYRPSGQTIQINAPAASADVYYVQSLKVNGKLSTRPWLPASFVADGGALDYTMSSQPNTAWGANVKDMPPSYG